MLKKMAVVVALVLLVSGFAQATADEISVPSTSKNLGILMYTPGVDSPSPVRVHIVAVEGYFKADDVYIVLEEAATGRRVATYCGAQSVTLLPDGAKVSARWLTQQWQRSTEVPLKPGTYRVLPYAVGAGGEGQLLVKDWLVTVR